MDSPNLFAKELSCPVCSEIFKAPVLLSCGHSFCKECLQKFWRTTDNQECPFCRRKSSKAEPPPNFSLQNLCKLFLKEKNERSSSGSEVCSLHEEKLTLFCLEDTQLVCVECVSQHINHTFRPISEAVPACKNTDDLIKKSTLIKAGNPARYRLQTSTANLNQSEKYRKITYGEKDKNKPHKSILLVGETGTGKTTLINAMINYMLGVQREDKVWFEITDDESDRTSVHSQTSILTLYGFYPQESPKDLTIIDTPGFGDTRGTDLDKQISKSLLSLSKSEEEIHEIHAVCLVMMAHQNRLSDRQIYIFDAVQSLFGKDITDNIVLLFTHSDGMRPKNALTAVKEAKIKSAVNEKNEPVYFLFNSHQSEPADEEYAMEQKYAWDLSFKATARLLKFLDTIQPKSLKMTQDVFQKRKHLDQKISNIKSRVELMELKQKKLKQTQAALEKNKEYAKDDKNFTYDVDVPYKEKVDIDPALARMAMCCTVCEENCHYPGCWWVNNLSWCKVMDKQGNCTVCTNKCRYTEHVKQPKIYLTKTKREKRTYEDLKKEYEGKIGDGMSLVKKLKEELQKLEKEKVKLVNEAYHSVDALEMIALNTDSLLTLQHIDFLIEKLKEINDPEKVKVLENIRMRAGEEKQGAMKYCLKYLGKKHF